MDIVRSSTESSWHSCCTALFPDDKSEVQWSNHISLNKPSRYQARSIGTRLSRPNSITELPKKRPYLRLILLQNRPQSQKLSLNQTIDNQETATHHKNVSSSISMKIANETRMKQTWNEQSRSGPKISTPDYSYPNFNRQSLNLAAEPRPHASQSHPSVKISPKQLSKLLISQPTTQFKQSPARDDIPSMPRLSQDPIVQRNVYTFTDCKNITLTHTPDHSVLSTHKKNENAEQPVGTGCHQNTLSKYASSKSSRLIIRNDEWDDPFRIRSLLMRSNTKTNSIRMSISHTGGMLDSIVEESEGVRVLKEKTCPAERANSPVVGLKKSSLGSRPGKPNPKVRHNSIGGVPHKVVNL